MTMAALLRARGGAVGPVRWLLIAALVVAAVAIAALPLLYVAIGLVIVAARRSALAPARPPAPVDPEGG